jgi:hypothetical protein
LWGEILADYGWIVLAAWVPLGGILLALCLYDLTSREAEPEPLDGQTHEAARAKREYGSSLDAE